MAQFRVCPDSGFYFDKNAESLMKANAVAGAVFLLIAGLLGLGVILTRWQEVHLLPADVFYQVLTGHGINALIFWIIFFEIAILYFASSTLLRTRLAAPRWAWLGFAPMIISAKPSQAQRGAASRVRNSVDDAKYRIAISKKMIQKISALIPCPVSTW